MTTPAPPNSISMSDVNIELERTYNQGISFNDGQVYALSHHNYDMNNMRNRSEAPVITGNADWSGFQQYMYTNDKYPVFEQAFGIGGYPMASRSAGNPWYDVNGNPHYLPGYGGGSNGPNTIGVTGGARAATIQFNFQVYAAAHAHIRMIIFTSDNRQIYNNWFDVNTYYGRGTPHYITVNAYDDIDRWPAARSYNVYVGTEYNGDYDYSFWNDGLVYFTAQLYSYKE